MFFSIIEMSTKPIASLKRRLNPVFAIVFLTVVTFVALAQKADPKDPKNAELGAQLIKQVIEARGGGRYLNFKTLFAVGQFTPFDQGISTMPAPFTYWLVLFEKERVDFGKGKKKDRRIQVNAGDAGWVYDGDAQTLKDQTDQQIKTHREDAQFDLDHLLRIGWKEGGVSTRFAGREELRPGERADVVLIQLKPDVPVYLWLDRNTHLPLSLIYEKTESGTLVKNEYRFFQWVAYDGVKFPNIVDFYRDGVQQNRVNYSTVKLDSPISEDIFAKPISVKAIK
ncbi:MAG: hypothetical protein JST85_10415 [Acidobacteria bacterium]|nr:hypothetical protein [Acidobacteriota bacterium]